MADDPSLTRSQYLIKEFNYDEQEDVEGCFARWSSKLGKDLHMDFRDIDIDSLEKIKTKDKQTLSCWLVNALDLVRRQDSQIYLLKEIIKCFKTEALADKEKVIRLQAQLLVQKDEQLKLLKTSVEKTVQTTVESGIQSYSAAVQKNSASDKVCNSSILKKVIKSVAAEEDRSKNLIMFGLKEEEEEQLPVLVTTVLEEIGEKPDFEATRVGWKRPGSMAIRPVKITVPSSTAVHQILMKTGKLRLVEKHKDIWICPDRSREERATRKNLVTDLKKKRAESDRHHLKSTNLNLRS